MTIYFTWPNIVIFLSVIVYFIFDHFEEKRVRDEREELIRLKTYEFVQKVNTFAFLLLSVAYFFIPDIEGILIIIILILSSLYTEIAAKIYYRQRF